MSSNPTPLSARPQTPAGRYGRADPGGRSTDRRLRIAAVVCAVLGLALVAWLGGSYLLRETRLNASVPTFQTLSDTEVQAHLSVEKRKGTSGVCTIRSQAADGSVVGLKDVPVPAAGSSFDQLVTITTKGRGTTAEVLGCVPDK